MQYIFSVTIDGQQITYRSESQELTGLVQQKMESLGYPVSSVYRAENAPPKTDTDALEQSKILRIVFSLKRNGK